MTIDIDAIRERSRKEPGGCYRDGPGGTCGSPVVVYSYLEAIVNGLFRKGSPWYVRRAKDMNDDKAIAWLRDMLHPILAPAYQAQQDRRDLLNALDRERGIYPVDDLDGMTISTERHGGVSIGAWRYSSVISDHVSRARLWSRQVDSRVFVLAVVCRGKGHWQWEAYDPDGARSDVESDDGTGHGHADERWQAQEAADNWLRARLLGKATP